VSPPGPGIPAPVEARGPLQARAWLLYRHGVHRTSQGWRPSAPAAPPHALSVCSFPSASLFVCLTSCVRRRRRLLPPGNRFAAPAAPAARARSPGLARSSLSRVRLLSLSPSFLCDGPLPSWPTRRAEAHRWAATTLPGAPALSSPQQQPKPSGQRAAGRSRSRRRPQAAVGSGRGASQRATGGRGGRPRLGCRRRSVAEEGGRPMQTVTPKAAAVDG
jgi:hypothetical protein